MKSMEFELKKQNRPPIGTSLKHKPCLSPLVCLILEADYKCFGANIARFRLPCRLWCALTMQKLRWWLWNACESEINVWNSRF